MFNTLLIANRGEIACRIIRTAQQSGIRCIAIYSDPDRYAQHVQLADEAYHVGPAASQDSYLNMTKILAIAEQAEADAIHPGYGFLAENTEFAQACEQRGIAFIGPSSQAIAAMGSKSRAKQIMQQANVPLVPGYHGDQQEPAFLQQQAEAIGFPVLLKAALGGGGKGMRVVTCRQEFPAALAAAKREAQKSFGDDHMIIEKYLDQPRHIEIQVFADQQGQCVYLFERDCSIQRRHQKIIEEAPAPHFTQDLRQRMGQAAVAAAQAIDYVGAGTVEFLLSAEGEFYFMEMNTRLQVEHPITEMICQQDLVAWQLRIASGEPLPLTQDQLTLNGHAIEARIYAEDPDNDFLPAVGTIDYLSFPAASTHVRVDSGIATGDTITPFYDPMIAKLIVWDHDRERAIQRLQRALWQCHIVGVTTNIAFLHRILSQPDYCQGTISTAFIPQHQTALAAQPTLTETSLIALASLYVLLQQAQTAQQQQATSADPNSPWGTADGWRLCGHYQPTLVFTVDQQTLWVNVTYQQAGYHLEWPGHTLLVHGELRPGQQLLATFGDRTLTATVIQQGQQLTLMGDGFHAQVTLQNNLDNDQNPLETTDKLTSPMPGTIINIAVTAGSQVAKGDALLIIEAMKMEHTIAAPSAGTVHELYFQQGDLVAEGVELLRFEAAC